MNRTCRSLAAIVVGASVSALVHAQGARRDGLWEVKMEMEMPGMPAGMGMPPTTTQQCVTPGDAKDPQKAMPPQGRGRGRGQSDCKVSDFKETGNKVTWSMQCDGGMTGTGEMTYATDSYTGAVKMEMAGGRGGMTMKYTGKRLGDCTK